MSGAKQLVASPFGASTARNSELQQLTRMDTENCNCRGFTRIHFVLVARGNCWAPLRRPEVVSVKLRAFSVRPVSGGGSHAFRLAISTEAARPNERPDFFLPSRGRCLIARACSRQYPCKSGSCPCASASSSGRSASSTADDPNGTARWRQRPAPDRSEPDPWWAILFRAQPGPPLDARRRR
jgi:hypothetical protein